MKPRQHSPDPDDPVYWEWLATELQNYQPELDEYDDWPIRWQWWRGQLYLASFRDLTTALAYGAQHGWVE